MSIKDKIKSAKPTQFFDDETVDGWSEWLEEHDKQIRTDVIEECIDAIAYCVSASECDEVLNELKEQK